MDVSFL